MKKEKIICKWCGKEFTPSYYVYDYNRPQCCSKSCALKLQQTKYKNRDELEKDIRNIIYKNGRYTLLQEITNELKISSKTLNKFKISIAKENSICGMRKPQSIFEKLIGDFLCKNFDKVESQKTFEDCISPKGYLLKYDFFIPNKNILVEADGVQHWDKNHPNYSDYTHQCDLIKNSYVQNNNITLIRIPYKKRITDQYILNYLKDFIDSPLTTT